MPMDSNKERERKIKKEKEILAHRQRAYAEYLQNKHKYPLPFDAYEIHHKNFNKGDKHTSNLKILTPKEHDWIHDEHEEKLRRRAEKIEERLEKIKQRQKHKKKKKIRIISILIVSVIVLFLILFLSLMSNSPGVEFPSLGYITIGTPQVYPDEISNLEQAGEVCNLRCDGSVDSVGANFPLGFITCNCGENQYVIDTRTLQDLTSAQIKRRERNKHA